jgi:hypothetical protein
VTLYGIRFDVLDVGKETVVLVEGWGYFAVGREQKHFSLILVCSDKDKRFAETHGSHFDIRDEFVVLRVVGGRVANQLSELLFGECLSIKLDIDELILIGSFKYLEFEVISLKKSSAVVEDADGLEGMLDFQRDGIEKSRRDDQCFREGFVFFVLLIRPLDAVRADLVLEDLALSKLYGKGLFVPHVQLLYHASEDVNNVVSNNE